MNTILGLHPETPTRTGVRYLPRAGGTALVIPAARRVTPQELERIRAYYHGQRTPKLAESTRRVDQVAAGAIVCWALLVLFVFSLFLGCGGTEQPRAHEEPAGAQSALEDDGIGEYTDSERSEAAEFMRQFTPSGNELAFDDFDRGMPPKAESGEVEKAGYAALTGWGISGQLAFQDGFNTEASPTGDHCSFYGLSCDNEWHAQATDIYLDGDETQLFEVVNGYGCGSGTISPGTGGSNLWMPCISADISTDHREITWAFDEGTCPRDAVGRKAIRDGILAAQSTMNRLTPISMREETEVQAMLDIYCDDTLPDTTAARWQPVGDLRLRYGALKGVADLNVLTYEQCETPGLPGYGRGGKNYQQGLDFMYSYHFGSIRLHYTAQFEKIAECTSDPSSMARAWRNTILHEVGHHLGFHHEDYDSDDFGIMFAGGVACERLTTFSRGFDEYHTFAMLDNDMDTSSGQIDIWDEDISCYNPLF